MKVKHEFELNSLPRNCSYEEILLEIKRVDALVAKDKLSRADYDKHAKISSDGIKKRFGSDWQKILMDAGLGHKYGGIKISERMRNQKTKSITNEEILNELRKIAKKLEREYITREDVRDHSEILSSSLVEYRFGSWINGLKKAGLKTAPAYKRKYSESEYFENLLNVWTHHARQPLLREMDAYPSVISSSAYESHFKSWRKALEAFVAKMNQDDKESNFEGTSAPANNKMPEEVIREEIKKHGVVTEDRHDIKLGLRYKVLCRDNFKCVRCGASPATDHSCRLHIDHKIPFSKGGKTVFENLQTLCENCNLGKGNRHLA